MIWQILLRGAVQGVIAAIRRKIGKEAVDVMEAAVLYAAQQALGGAEARVAAQAHFLEQARELKLAVYDEVTATVRDGLPSLLNFLLEAIVQRTKLTP